MNWKSVKGFVAVLLLEAGVVFCPSAAFSRPADDFPAIIPKPVSMKKGEGRFLLSGSTALVLRNRQLAPEAGLLNEFLTKNFEMPLQFRSRPIRGGNEVVLDLKPDKGSPEGYHLLVTPDEIHISGSAAGVFHGIQTLAQILPDMKSPQVPVPCLSIDDAPRYAWRGMHLDVCRHFFPVSFVKKYIDLIALYKMNTFHWHLTDDQGWRIEIRKYPKLTQVGAWRNGSMVGAFSEQRFDTIRYGGFYTQKEIREVVAYAARRHVTVVPEIEMPGHALAALAAYPEYSCTGGPFDVGKAWGVYDDVFCAKPGTFVFLQNVLAEVCALFPGKFIHVGGDECPKVRWKACPRCQEVMRRNHLRDENELQSYFTKKIERFLNSKGKRLIGWDEILEGGIAPHAAVMSWRGTDGGIAAARLKHDVVMTPGSHCYFDYYQGTPQFEPLAIGGYTPVEKVYSYEPTPAELTAEEGAHILGAQGNVWTEYIPTSDQAEYMALPRMAALAEVLWSPKEGREYLEFRGRLLRHFSFLDRMNVHYSKAIYELNLEVASLAGHNGVAVRITSPFDSAGVRYTTDGTEPAQTSASYAGPVSVVASGTLKAAYFNQGKKEGYTIAQSFTVSKSTGKTIELKVPADARYPGHGASTLVDGIRGDFTRHGQNWLGWWGPDMEATVDLGTAQEISRVTMDAFDGEGSWIHLPAGIEVSVSTDSVTYRNVATVSAADIRKNGNVIQIDVPKQQARFVKVIAKNAGIIPPGKPGAGQHAWLFIDEIIIE